MPYKYSILKVNREEKSRIAKDELISNNGRSRRSSSCGGGISAADVAVSRRYGRLSAWEGDAASCWSGSPLADVETFGCMRPCWALCRVALATVRKRRTNSLTTTHKEQCSC